MSKECRDCGGTGKCHWCSPRGTGKNSDGTKCKVCMGTGRCTKCSGSGKDNS